MAWSASAGYPRGRSFSCACGFILRFLEAPRLDEDAGQAIAEGVADFEHATHQFADQQKEPAMQDCPDDKTDSGADDGAEEGAEGAEEGAEEVALERAEQGATEAAIRAKASSSRPSHMEEATDDLNEAALVMCL